MVQARDYIDDLVADNRHEFTTAQMGDDLGVSADAARAKIRRLRNKGNISTPKRSFHVIVPPNFQFRASVPAEYYVDQLMSHLQEPYYVGLLTAADKYGASHQKPQVFQVIVKKNRPQILCGRSRIQFIARGDMEKMPVRIRETKWGTIKLSTPELTAFELMGYSVKAGGCSNTATVLIELAEKLDAKLLASVARLQPISWVQRLGFVLDFIKEHELAESLIPQVRKRARNFAPLVRHTSTKGGIRNAKWKLIYNLKLEPDLW